MHCAFIPPFSHLPLAENVPALHVACTYQGLDPAVKGLGRQHRFMAQTTWSLSCTAKGGGLLTPQTLQTFLPAGCDSSSSPAPRGIGSTTPGEKSSPCNESSFGVSA